MKKSLFVSVCGAAGCCFLSLLSTGWGLDLDGDGLSDVVEIRLGRDIDPAADSDLDGFTDGFEISWSRDPFDAQDNVLPWSGLERSGGTTEIHFETVLGAVYQVQVSVLGGAWVDDGPPHNGTGLPIVYSLEVTETEFDFRVSVSDGADLDNDGLSAREEFILGTDPTATDTDGDGLSDGQEAAWQMHPLDQDEDNNGVADGLDDFDSDGINNADESVAGTDAVPIPGPVRPAIWSELIGAAAQYVPGQGSTVVKTLDENGWNASATARQDLLADAIVGFTAVADNKEILVGWGEYVPGLYPGTAIVSDRLSHAIFLQPGGDAQIYEQGDFTGVVVAYTAGSRFELRRSAGQVTYWQNGNLIHTSVIHSDLPLRPSVSLISQNSQVVDFTVAGIGDTDLDLDGMTDDCEGIIRFADPNDGLTTLESVLPGDDFDGDGSENRNECACGTDPSNPQDFASNVLWRQLNGLIAVDDAPGGAVLQKSAVGDAWSSVAIARQEWAGNGQLRWRFTGGDALLGFTTSQEAPAGIVSVNYGIMADSNKVRVYEGGVKEFAGTSFTPLDLFAVERVGDSIRYLKNGRIFYWSQVPLESALRAHALIHDAGTSVMDIQFRGQTVHDIDTDDDGMRDLSEQRIIDAVIDDAFALLEDVDPEDDFDGDGVTNRNEALDGTDPADSASAFQPVDWSDIQGVQVTSAPPGSTIQKIATTNQWDARGISSQYVDDLGVLRFSIVPEGALFDPENASVAAGFYSGGAGNGTTPLDWAFQAKNNGAVYVFQSGVEVAFVGKTDATAVFELERSAGAIKFRRNGIEVWNAQDSNSNPIQAMAMLRTESAAIAKARVFGFTHPDADGDGLPDEWEYLIIDHDPEDAIVDLAGVTPEGDVDDDGVSNLREFEEGSSPIQPYDWFEPVQWVDLVKSAVTSVLPTGSTLHKTGDKQKWDASAWSAQSLSGDGALQFKVDAGNIRTWIHLRDPQAPDGDPTDASLRIHSNDRATLFVESLQIGAEEGVSPDDLLEIRRNGSIISFLKNGRLIASAETTTPPLAELRVQAEIRTPSASLLLCRTRGFRGTDWDFDGDGLPDEWELDFLQRISLSGTDDPDGDGRPNSEEFANGTDPLNYFDEPPVLVLLSSADQEAPPTTVLSDPVRVEARSGSGELLVNAPVVFDVQSGGGGFSATPDGMFAQSVTIYTDSSGIASAYYQTGTAVGVTATLSASADVASVEAKVEIIPSSNEPPQLQVIAPTTGSTFGPGEQIEFTLSATDADGTIESVDLFLRGGQIGSAQISGSDYVFTWTTPPPGNHPVIVRATDDRGKHTFETITIRIESAPSNSEALGEVVGGIHMAVEPGDETSLSLPLAIPLSYIGRVKEHNGARISLTGSPDWNPSKFAGGDYWLSFADGSLEGSWLPISASGPDWVEVEDPAWLTNLGAADAVRIGAFWSLESAFPASEPTVAATNSNDATRISLFAAGTTLGEAFFYRGADDWLTGTGASISEDWFLPGEALTLIQPVTASSSVWQPTGEAIVWMSLAPVGQDPVDPVDTFLGGLNLTSLTLEESGLASSLALVSTDVGSPPGDQIMLLPWPGESPRTFWLEEGNWRDADGPAGDAILRPGRALLIHRGPGTSLPPSWPRWPSF